MNKIRHDHEKGYRQSKARNGYYYLGVNDDGQVIYEKDGTIYREEDYRYLVETGDVTIYHHEGGNGGNYEYKC